MGDNSTNYDFCGWATRNNIVCSDGRVIRRNAFAHCDGATVPLIWNHKHGEANSVLGHAVLENRDDGVYAYGYFNDTPEGQHAKESVKHGDVTSLSIFANKLKEEGHDVIHGMIREVSLVLAGANPGAYIETVMCHSDDDSYDAHIYYEEEFGKTYIEHADNNKEGDKQMAESEKKVPEQNSESKKDDDKTVQDVIDTMNEEQKTVLYALVGAAANSNEDSKGGSDMKHNVFEGENEMSDRYTLSHSDEQKIMQMAKESRYGGTLRGAMKAFAEEKSASLSHGFMDDTAIEQLFPEYELLKKGEPELLTNDQTWIDGVIAGVKKSPFSRVKTRQADVRNKEGIRALGYVKGKKKKDMGDITLLSRTTDPQTIYVKDYLNRDDIVDITDFDAAAFQYKIMRMTLNEELAMAIMVGDRRDDDDADKISAAHIRPIWTDDNLYTIHQDVDIEAMKTSLQGSDTSKNFGDNYIYAEAIIQAALYAREKYKGSGNLKFYCTPHLVNVMLLARDLNGRRIYGTVDELRAALNVTAIETAEQFEGLQRTDSLMQKHELLGLFVNLGDYQVGSTKGGEITKFEQFDIDYNQEKYLLETRVSGALTRVYSAIALELPVSSSANTEG